MTDRKSSHTKCCVLLGCLNGNFAAQVATNKHSLQSYRKRDGERGREGGGEGEAGKFERINKSYWLLISSQFRVVCAVFLTFHEIFSRKI